MGFLMILRYPGTDLGLTGVRNGPASWWLSSSAKSILKKTDQWPLIHTQTEETDRSSGTVPAQGQVFTGLSGCFGTLLLCRVSGRTLLCLPLLHVLWQFSGRAVGAAQILLRVSRHRRFLVPLGLSRFLQASAWADQSLLGLQGLTARLHRDKRFSEETTPPNTGQRLWGLHEEQTTVHSAAFVGPLNVFTCLSIFRDACVLGNWNQMEGLGRNKIFMVLNG